MRNVMVQTENQRRYKEAEKPFSVSLYLFCFLPGLMDEVVRGYESVIPQGVLKVSRKKK